MKRPATTPSTRAAGETKTKAKRNRALEAAETIKDWIIADGLAPGDRLPQEPELIEKLGNSKGTVREALKVLETQGLIRTRTGPGGGAFITEAERNLAVALAANYLFFKEVTIAQIYDLRTALEPLVAGEVAAHITEEQISLLRAKMGTYTRPPASMREEKRQRVAELEFHETLAGFSRNAPLAFVCSFLARLLKELTVCKRIYEQPNPELRQTGLTYQQKLIEAFLSRDSRQAREVMKKHMRTARRIMLAQEAQLKKGFLSLTDES